MTNPMTAQELDWLVSSLHSKADTALKGDDVWITQAADQITALRGEVEQWRHAAAQNIAFGTLGCPADPGAAIKCVVDLARAEERMGYEEDIDTLRVERDVLLKAANMLLDHFDVISPGDEHEQKQVRNAAAGGGV